MKPRIRRSGSRPNFAVLDLFSGCGGLIEGFTSVRDRPARLVPAKAVELDPSAAATYAANFGSHVFQGDIADWLGTDELAEIDVVAGGPPCQGFSTLGKRDPDDARNKLWLRYAEAVAAVKPYYFVLENVEPFLRSSQYQDLLGLTRPGELLCDYTLDDSPLLVRASDFGAAQNRRRAVVIGRRSGLPAVHLTKTTKQMTVRDVIGHLPQTVRQKDLPQRSCTVAVENRAIDTDGVFLTSELHVTRNFSDISLRRFQAIEEGGNRHSLPHDLKAPCWQRNPAGANDVMGRMHWDRPSVTIRTEFFKPEKGRYLHPQADRPITHMEAALLQGFPEDFRWCGRKSDIARQIGNAVPVALGQAIAAGVLDGLVAAGVEPKG